MFQIIFDFLLEPGLITTGLLALPALALLWMSARAAGEPHPSPRRQLAAWLGGVLLGLVALLAMESAAVLKSAPLFVDLSWPLIGLLWILVAALSLKTRWHALWAGALIGLLGWLIHTQITAELLFE